MSKKRKIPFYLLLFLFIIIECSRLYAHETGGETGIANHMVLLVFQLAVILLAAKAGGTVFEKLKLPAVLGEIVAGIIIGPYLLGQIPLFGFEHGLFPLHKGFPVSLELYSFTTVASIVLLFLVGLETDIETFLRFSISGSVIGIGGVIFSFILGDLAGMLFMKFVSGTNFGFTHPVPLFFGVISTATSVGITARILSEKKKMNSPEGVTIISGAVIDDIIGIIILAIVVGIVKSGNIAWKQITMISLKAVAIWIGFTVLGLVFSRQISSFLKRFKDKSVITVMSFALALLLAGIFEKSGLAMIIGAYIMGLSLSKTDLSYTIQEYISILYNFFVPIFFCVMGMLVNLKAMTSLTIIFLGMIYLLFAILGKLIGCALPAFFLNFNSKGAIRIGVGMIPRGEVALIIASIGLSAGILSDDAFSIAIFMTFITTLITPPILAKMFESDVPVLRKEKQIKKEYKQIVYDMPNPETGDLLLNKTIEAFEQEGFYIYHLELVEKIYQIRKEDTFITMRYDSEKIVFDCQSKDVPFVHTLFYEILAELENVMKKLQSFTDKENIGKKIFEKESDVIAPKSGISRIIKPLNVENNLKSSTKDEIIKELLSLLITSGHLTEANQAEALTDLFNREATMSTGMQDGIALPHARSSAVERIISAVGLKKEGIDFNSLDNKPAQIFVITLSPKAYPEPYLQFMAEITKFLRNPENREKILSCRTNEELYKVFT